MSQRAEYRVRWTREGRREKFVIRQSWSAAYGKARAILAADELAKDPTVDYYDKEPLPRLVSLPVIEERPVGDWIAVDVEIVPPTDGLVQEVAWRMGVTVEQTNEAEEVEHGLAF